MYLDFLVEQFDLPEFMENRGYPLRYGSGNTRYLTTCPWCGKEEHFGFDPEKNIFGCFKCKVAGNSLKLIKKVYDKPMSELIEFLKTGVDKRYVNIDFLDSHIEVFKEQELIQAKIKPIELPEGYEYLYNKRIPYLDYRRVPQDQVNYYKMGVCLHGYYKDRLIVCDVNEKQEPIYWIARDITGRQKKKVLNPVVKEGAVGSGDLIFNFSLAKNYKIGIIVEGMFDALRVGNCGMATYGKGLKSHHIGWLLQGGFEEMVLLYDADVKDDELEKNALLLAQFFPTKIAKLPSGDPDSYDVPALWTFINQAKAYDGDKISKLRRELTV